MIEPLTLGLAYGGFGAAQSLLGFSSAQQQAAQQNNALIDDYRQRLRIQQLQDTTRFNEYNLKVASYKNRLVNLNKTYNLENVQAQQTLNQLEKQQRFAAQTENINRVQALGKAAASGQQGASAARGLALTSAEFGRRSAARQERMLGEYQAADLRAQARTLGLAAAQRAAYNKVAFAPMASPTPLAPTMLQGPSVAGLFANLIGNGLSGLSASMGQANFEKQLVSGNPNDAPLPTFSTTLGSLAAGG